MSLAYERLYLDLDRTLLDTPRFTEAVITNMEQGYHIPAKDFQARMPDFYVQHGSMRYYDFFAHVVALGLNAAAVRTRLHTALKSKDFLYPDVRPLLQFLKQNHCEARILSYGISNYQQFKMEFLPDLQVLPFVATLQFKQDYLAAQNPKPSLLVDDKLVSPLPEWCTQFLLDRSTSAVSTHEGAQLWHINSLQAVETAMSVGYNERNQKE